LKLLKPELGLQNFVFRVIWNSATVSNHS